MGQSIKALLSHFYDSLHQYGSFYLLVSILFFGNSKVRIGSHFFYQSFRLIRLIHFSLSASPVAEVPEDDFILAEKKYLVLTTCPCPSPPPSGALSRLLCLGPQCQTSAPTRWAECP